MNQHQEVEMFQTSLGQPLIEIDPLDVHLGKQGNLSTDVAVESIKLRIRNILTSYNNRFDVISELVQNSLDAIENRRKSSKNDYIPTIWVAINLKEDSLCISDNGVGFSKEQFQSFLAPDISFKKKEQGYRGNKGVGATYLAYGFNFIQVGTKTPDFAYVGSMKDAREWVENKSPISIRPKIQPSEPIHEVFDQIDQGSTFCIKLIGDYIRPKDLGWTGATTADQWEVILRLKTPLGGIYFERDSQARCYVSVIDKNGLKTEKTIESCSYLYPHTQISTCKSLNELVKAQDDLLRKKGTRSPVSLRLPPNCYQLNGLYNFWDSDTLLSQEFKGQGQLDDNDRKLIQEYKVNCYGFLCYSIDIWNKYNDDLVKLRKGDRILRGGLQLAANSMPQGNLQTIPLLRTIFYQNLAHVVVHFEGADPDLGRKGFQPELEDLAKRISSLIVRQLLNWKEHLKKDVGAPPNILEEKKLHEWVRELEEHEKDKHLLIKRQDVFLPTKEPCLTSEPRTEQDVIVLFSQLLAGGVIRGVKLMATSQHQQYDGVCKLWLEKPFANHIFNKEKNPLGIEESRARDEFISPPRVLEYKYSFDLLINDFEKEEKNEREVNLIIVWEMGKEWKKSYEITPLLDLSNLQHRYFHGGTHIVRSASVGNVGFDLIVLSELIDYINDPDAVQDYQKTTYFDEV